MRYKNLTITITLGCLSILALAGLVMLPITNVICDVQNFGWTEYDGGQAARYYNMRDIANESWFLIAGVNAKGIGASGGVGILTKDHYTESQDTLMGSANLKVKRNAYTWYHKNIFLQVAWWKRCNNICYRDHLHRVSYCGGHREPEIADSNIAGTEGFKPFYDFTDEDGNPVPRHTNISLKVKVREGTYKWVYGRSKKNKTTGKIKVGGSAPYVTGETEFILENETYITTGQSSEYPQEKVINEAATSSHSVSLEFEKKADSSASASVRFREVSDAKTVSYTGQP